MGFLYADLLNVVFTYSTDRWEVQAAGVELGVRFSAFCSSFL